TQKPESVATERHSEILCADTTNPSDCGDLNNKKARGSGAKQDLNAPKTFLEPPSDDERQETNADEDGDRKRAVPLRFDSLSPPRRRSLKDKRMTFGLRHQKEKQDGWEPSDNEQEVPLLLASRSECSSIYDEEG